MCFHMTSNLTIVQLPYLHYLQCITCPPTLISPDRIWSAVVNAASVSPLLSERNGL